MDEFLILLQAKLDEAKSKGNVDADIEKLQSQLNKLKVQVELDPKAAQKLADSIGKLINQKIVISNIGIDAKSGVKAGQEYGKQISQGISQGMSSASKSTEKILRDFSELNDVKRKFVDGHDLISKDDIADAEKLYDTVRKAFSEFGQVTVSKGSMNDGSLENMRVKIEQVNGEMKITRDFMLYFNESKNGFKLVDDDTIRTTEKMVQHLNEEKNIVNATNEEANAIKAKLAEQEKYYKNIKNEVNNLYNLKKQLLSADQLQTAELEKQIKQTKERISYNNKQVDKKDLRDSSLDRQINDLEVAQQKQLDLASAKSQDTINTKELAQAEREATAALKERQAIEAQVNKIQLSMAGKNKKSQNYDYQIDTEIKKLKDLGFTDEEVAQKVKILTDAQAELKRVMDSNDFDSVVSKNKVIIESDKERTIALNQVRTAYSQLKNDTSQYYNLNKQTKLSTDIQNWLSKNSRASKEAKESLNAYYRELSGGRVSVDRLDYIEQELKSIDATQRGLGKLGKNLKDQFKEASASFTQWLSVSSGIMALVYQLQKMPKEVIKVNSAMVELNKVSDASASDIKKYFNEATKSAKKYGSAVSDMINATADWSRLGYSLPDSKKLAEVATLYKNVGDGIDISTANESLVSTLQGFKLEASDAMHIIDAFNEVGNNFAIGSDGIGEALKRSASSMYAAGNTLEETIGLVTAANAVVQDPDSIGTAYKTISMRIRGAKTEMEELGLETDGMVESTATLQKEIMALSGVDIMKDKDTFKSTYQILDELATKWTDLTDIQQASITELIAGKRQGNIVSALMSNFETARQATESAINSTGSALKEQEAYEQGIQYSLDRLEASFQAFANHILDSNFLKGIIDFGNGTINVIDTVTSKLGSLGTIGLGAGLFAGVKNTGKCRISVRISNHCYFCFGYALHA